jgi:hypothetical protein
MDKPITVISVADGQVRIVAGLVPTAVSVSLRNEFAIYLLQLYDIIIPQY